MLPSINYGISFARAAEIQKGLRLYETFRSDIEIEENGGASSNLSFVNRQAIFNGTTSKVTYANTPIKNDSFTLNFHITKETQLNSVGIITTHRSTTDGFVMYFNAANNIYFDYYDLNGSAYNITTTTGDFTTGEYVITLRYDKDNSKFEILKNGVVRGTRTVATGLKIVPALLQIGGFSIYYFTGKMSRFDLFCCKLSGEEIVAYSDDSMWRYNDPENLALCMDGRAIRHDPTNNRVLDASGNENHITKGDGAGVGEPSKADGMGYDFDGVDDYLQLPDRTGKFPYIYVSISGQWQWTTSTTVYDAIKTSGGFSGRLFAVYLYDADINATQFLDLKNSINPNELGA